MSRARFMASVVARRRAAEHRRKPAETAGENPLALRRRIPRERERGGCGPRLNPPKRPFNRLKSLCYFARRPDDVEPPGDRGATLRPPGRAETSGPLCPGEG